MKRIYILILFVVSGLWQGVLAQTVTSSPQKFTALDGVTLTFDVSGTSVAGLNEPLYLWGWSNVGDFLINGDWGSSSEASRLTPVEGSPNLFTFTLPLTANGTTYNNVAEILGATPGDVKTLGVLIKTKVGNDSKKTGDIAMTLDPLIFIENFTRTFPSTVTQYDLVTIYMKQSLASRANVKYATGSFMLVMKAFDEDGIMVGEEKAFEMKAEGKNVFSYPFYPTVTAFPAVESIAKIEYHFESVADPSVSSETFTINFVR